MSIAERIKIPEQLDAARTRTFDSTQRPVLDFQYLDGDAIVVNVTGQNFRASLKRLASEGDQVSGGALYEVTPTIVSGTGGLVRVSTAAAGAIGRMFHFRLRRWRVGATPNIDAPDGVHEETWHIPR